MCPSYPPIGRKSVGWDVRRDWLKGFEPADYAALIADVERVWFKTQRHQDVHRKNPASVGKHVGDENLQQVYIVMQHNAHVSVYQSGVLDVGVERSPIDAGPPSKQQTVGTGAARRSARQAEQKTNNDRATLIQACSGGSGQKRKKRKVEYVKGSPRSNVTAFVNTNGENTGVGDISELHPRSVEMLTAAVYNCKSLTNDQLPPIVVIVKKPPKSDAQETHVDGYHAYHNKFLLLSKHGGVNQTRLLEQGYPT